MAKLFAVVVSALVADSAAWNSTDQRHKQARDRTELQEQSDIETNLTALTRFKDNLLHGNQTILKIQKQQLDAVVGNLRNIKKNVLECQQQLDALRNETTEAHADAAKKKQNAEEARAKLTEAKRGVVAAQNAVADARQEKNAIAVKLAGAKHELQHAVLHAPEKLPFLQTEVQRHESDMQQADQDILEKVRGQKEADVSANKAADAASAAGRAQQDAEKMASGKDGEVKAMDDQCARLSSTDGSREQLKANITSAVAKQLELVDARKADSKAAHEKLEAQQKKDNELADSYHHDRECVSRLQRQEAVLVNRRNEYAAMAKAYLAQKDEMFAETWRARDALDEAKYQHYLAQVDCAPAGRKPKAHPKFQGCEVQTEGRCNLKRVLGSFWGSGCDSDRGNAYCDQRGYTCDCMPGWCASPNRSTCLIRGSPVEDIAMPSFSERKVGDAIEGVWVAVVLFSVALATLTGVRHLNFRAAPQLAEPLLSRAVLG